MSKNLANREKDSDEVLDYKFDWTAWLTGAETIASAVIEISDPTLTQPQAAVVAPTIVTVWVAAGTVGLRYTIRCRITTNSSPARVAEREFTLRVI